VESETKENGVQNQQYLNSREKLKQPKKQTYSIPVKYAENPNIKKGGSEQVRYYKNKNG